MNVNRAVRTTTADLFTSFGGGEEVAGIAAAAHVQAIVDAIQSFGNTVCTNTKQLS